MEFLRGLELAMKHGLTKEEFKSIWEFELTIKQTGSNRAQESRNTPPPSYHDDMRAAIEAHLPPHSSQLSQERDDLMFDVQKHLQSLLCQFQEQQQILSDNVHSQLEKMKTDFECHFDLLSQLVANSAENLTSSLKIFIIQEMEVMKQDLQIKFESFNSSPLTNHTSKISSKVKDTCQGFKSKLEPQDTVSSNSDDEYDNYENFKAKKQPQDTAGLNFRREYNDKNYSLNFPAQPQDTVGSNLQKLFDVNYPSVNSLAQPQDIVQSKSQMEKEVFYHNLKSPMQSENTVQLNSGTEGKSLMSLAQSNSGSEDKYLKSQAQTHVMRESEDSSGHSSTECLLSLGAVSVVGNCSKFRDSGQRYLSPFFLTRSKMFRVRVGISFDASEQLMIELRVSKGELHSSLSGSIHFKSRGYINQARPNESLWLSPIWRLNIVVHNCLQGQEEIVFKPSVQLSTKKGEVITNVTYHTLNSKSYTRQNCLQFKWYFYGRRW